ncbi:cytochrome P450 [Macrophomina phaseolina]|uniref:Cytochrome P450 n=1 Tax=Macrophomina phaseolina TaxID=35725 RepID=A0ABQ8FV29_9PEZI|nr:cytochrome P450 [Macrophomina phaseolina]
MEHGSYLSVLPPSFASALGLVLLLKASLLLSLLYFIGGAVYNVYFHPLSKYPGPKYAAASKAPYRFIATRGDLVHWTHAQHQRYGPVVRLGPNQLSYISGRAFKEIYGHRTGGKKVVIKDPDVYLPELNGKHHIVSIHDDEAHGPYRRVFSPAFSDKALKAQESLIRTYADKLVDNIRAKAGDWYNAVKLYNCTTFDIMADLTFGESLGLLDNGQYWPWVEAIFQGIKVLDLRGAGSEFPLLRPLLGALIPKKLLAGARDNFQFAVDRVNKRIARHESGEDKGRPDIWGLTLEGKGKELLTLDDMHANGSVFMLAGTETTATLLSGLTYHLLKNPDKMRRVVDEVRALEREEDLNLEGLRRLKYMSACFEEALRCYPPVPIMQPRVSPEGGMAIEGEWVPGGTKIGCSHWAAYHSESNFERADEFIPERWLPESSFPGDKKEALNPFLLGPRSCLGKKQVSPEPFYEPSTNKFSLAYHEMRIILAKVLWHFDLELSPESENWTDQKVWILWDKVPLLVRAKPVR